MSDADLSGSPERALWLAVLAQAALDAEHGVDGNRMTEAEQDHHQDQACLFLIRKDSAWARSRRAVCWAAGVDPDWLRETALKRPLIVSGTTVGSILGV